MMPRRPDWGVAYNPYYEKPKRFGTTKTELVHIVIAMLALTLVLYLVFKLNGAYDKIENQGEPFMIVVALAISLFGFVLHELGHKITAQHFGHWSEFRANWSMLGLALLIAYFPPHIPFAAPGATWHTGSSLRDQGRISAAGPIVNLVIAFLAFPVTLLSDPGQELLKQLAGIVVFFSAFLAAFNLVPLGALDGRKVIAWNPFAWALLMAIAVALLFQGFQQGLF